MHIASYPEADVPLELREQVIALQEQAWPSAGPASPEPWHDPELHPLSVMLIDEGRVLAALDILSKDLVHRGQRYAASGISATVTDRDRRGRGHGRTLVVAARELMAAGIADLGIFTCDAPLQGFYEAAGWRHLPGTVLIGGTPQEPFPSDQFDKVTMAEFFSERARAAAEGFIGCQVELYPGRIDRLW